MDEICLLAISEAYGAKDAARGMQEMQGQSQLQVVEAYFTANPEIKRWVDRNIEASACAAAVAEMREKKEHLRRSRQEGNSKAVWPRDRDPALEWLHQAARGYAMKRGE
jgi:hypothetical protein